MLRKLLIGGIIAATVVLPLALATGAVADGSDVNDPGSGCNDQVNGPSCVPDPSENGQDCEAHGQNEDGNENHCLTTTTTIPPTTTVTVPPPSDTTTTEPPPVTSTTTVPATTTSAPAPTHTNSPIPPTTVTHGGNSGGGSQTHAETPLAFTGVEDIVPIAAIAGALALIGLWFMWVARKR